MCLGRYLTGNERGEKRSAVATAYCIPVMLLLLLLLFDMREHERKRTIERNTSGFYWRTRTCLFSLYVQFHLWPTEAVHFPLNPLLLFLNTFLCFFFFFYIRYSPTCFSPALSFFLSIVDQPFYIEINSSMKIYINLIYPWLNLKDIFERKKKNKRQTKKKIFYVYICIWNSLKKYTEDNFRFVYLHKRTKKKIK